MPSWVRKFYEAYGRVIPKIKGRLNISLKPVDVVKVRVVPIPCSEIEINDSLGCKFWL